MQPCGPADQTRPGPEPRSGRGAVLLEVLLALGLFVVAAAVVTGGLNAAVERTVRLRAQTHALDLAASVVSELEMGLRGAQAGGPESFEPPFDQWTWEIEVAPYTFGTENAPGLQLVTVIVRCETPPTIQRLTAILAPHVEAGQSGDGFGGWDSAALRLEGYKATVHGERVDVQRFHVQGDDEPVWEGRSRGCGRVPGSRESWSSVGASRSSALREISVLRMGRFRVSVDNQQLNPHEDHDLERFMSQLSTLNSQFAVSMSGVNTCGRLLGRDLAMTRRSDGAERCGMPGPGEASRG